jgi:hypothetical protein
MVNLVLSASHEAFLSGESSPVGMETLATRPTFPLVPSGERKDVYFPEVEGNKGQYGFILDFTDGGTCPGPVMSQSRMREIEMILNPFGVMAPVNVPMMPFGMANWIDMLVRHAISWFDASLTPCFQLNPQGQVSTEYYNAIYVRRRFCLSVGCFD